MIACPNINTQEWKSLEGALGENRAYLAYFRANKGAKELRIPTVEEGKNLIKGNQTVEQSILKELQHYGMIAKRQYKSKIKKFRGKVLFSIPKIRTVSDIKEYIGLESNAVLFKRNEGAINNLRDFNMSWFTMERTANADFLAVDEDIYKGRRTIDVKPFESNNKEVDDGDYMNYLQWWHTLSPDQKASENALRVQDGLDELPIEEGFQKESFMNTKESINKTQKKIETMMAVMKARGINVEVRLDEKLPQKGKFTREKNKNIITLNPNKISPDTAIHEFAHIFIEELGGLNNQRIRAAVNVLRTSRLYEQVRELYPELTAEELDKEVLATAIGLEGAEIFADNKEKAGFINRFKDWFVNFVSQKLGLSNTAVTQLTRELIGQSTYETRASDLAYEKRNFSNEINNINDVIKVIIDDLKVRTREIKKMEGSPEKIEEMVDNLDGIRENIQRFYKNYDASVALSYIEDAYQQLSQAAADLQGDVSLSRIHIIQTYLSSYEMLPSIRKVLNRQNFTPETKQKINDNIDASLRLIEETKSKITDKRKEAVVEQFSKTSLYGIGVLKERFEIEANQKYASETKSVRKKLVEDEVNRRLAESEDEALEINRGYFSSIVDFTNADISSVSAWVNDPANTTSATLSMTTRLLDSTDAKTRSFFLKERERIHTAVHKFYKTVGKKYGKDPFKNLISTDSNGVKYLYTGIKPEYLEEISKYDEAISKLFVKRKESEENLAGIFLDASEKVNAIFTEFGIEPVSQVTGKKELSAFFIKVASQKLKENADRMPSGKQQRATKLINDLQKALDQDRNNIKLLKAENKKKNVWVDQNTDSKRNILDKWKDNRKLSDAEKELLEVFKESFIGMDEGLPEGKKLSSEVDGHVFIKLPSITTTVYEGDVKNAFDRTFRVQADEEELGELGDLSEFRRLGITAVQTDIGFTEKKAIPILYRGTMDPKKQSNDIASMVMMNVFTTENYRQKKAIEPILYAISDVTAKKKVGITQGLGKILKVSSANMQRQLEKPGVESNEYQALQSTLNVRVYGKHLKEMGDLMFGVSGEKVVQNVESYTSNLLLGFNYMANVVNIMQGKTMQLVEALSDKRYSGKSFAAAEKKFLAQLVSKDSIVSDYGTLDKQSETWKMIEALNLFGDFGTKERFAQEGWKKQLLSLDTIHMGQQMGEIYIHGSLTYMILGENKVMNDKRQYLDINGKVVESKEDAASLLDFMTFEEGQMKFRLFKVGNKTFKTREEALEQKKKSGGDIKEIAPKFSTLNNGAIDTLEGVDHIGATIKNLAADLYGQYDPNMKSMAQTYWWGRLAFGLRKWLVRGFNKRYRGAYATFKDKRDIDRTFNEQTGEFEEGSYVTFIRFVRNLIRSTEDIKDLITGHSGNRTWNGLTEMEKRNVLRSLYEMTAATSAYMIYAIAQGLAEEDDDNKELWYHLAYANRRLHSELMFFTSPSEAQKIVRSPFAALSVVQKIGSFQEQIFSDLVSGEFEVYETGYRKGTYKSWEKLKNAAPVLNYIDDFSRMEEKLRYMSSYRSF